MHISDGKLRLMIVGDYVNESGCILVKEYGIWLWLVTLDFRNVLYYLIFFLSHVVVGGSVLPSFTSGK